MNEISSAVKHYFLKEIKITWRMVGEDQNVGTEKIKMNLMKVVPIRSHIMIKNQKNYVFDN